MILPFMWFAPAPTSVATHTAKASNCLGCRIACPLNFKLVILVMVKPDRKLNQFVHITACVVDMSISFSSVSLVFMPLTSMHFLNSVCCACIECNWAAASARPSSNEQPRPVVCISDVCLVVFFVNRSARFSEPGVFLKRILFLISCSCSHNAPVCRWRILPIPYRSMTPEAADASTSITTVLSRPKSFNRATIPMDSVAALVVA